MDGLIYKKQHLLHMWTAIGYSVVPTGMRTTENRIAWKMRDFSITQTLQTTFSSPDGNRQWYESIENRGIHATHSRSKPGGNVT